MNAQKQSRAAFLFNANAKSVTRHMHKKLTELIPTKDLYFSYSLHQAQQSIYSVAEQNYAYLFCGGGDGTIISAINILNGYKERHPHRHVPKLGVLRLGTGNAIARFLNAKDPQQDIKSILGGSPIKPIELSMIEASSGQLTPFAGIGYDGELMNDFETVKDVFFESPFRKLFSSVVGFTVAGVLKTLPRQVARKLPIVKVKSSYPAYRIMEINGVDEEVYIDSDKVLYNDVGPLICVGTIPWVGYGITMFPFANKRPGYMQLRISAVPISVCLSKLYPSIWHGTFRHKKLFDFLVKDVTIESDESLPYQLGGDAMGYKKQLYFKVSGHPIAMASLNGRPKGLRLPQKPVMMPL